MFTLRGQRAGALRRAIRSGLVPAAVFLVALPALFAGAAAAQPATPAIAAEIGGSVLGNSFTPASTATVRIYASPGGALLYEGSVATIDGGFELEDRTHGQQLAPGMFVSATDDATGIVKELTLVALTFDYLNPTTDIASGTAPPGATVLVYSSPSDGWDEAQELATTAGADGTWLADFGAAGLEVGEDGSARVMDEDGDETSSYRIAPRLSVTYDFSWRQNLGVDGYGFTADGSVQVQFFASPGGPLLGATTIPTDAAGEFNHCCVIPELVDVDVTPGMQVVVTDPETTMAKDVTLVWLTVDEVDPVADTVSGTAPPGTELVVTEAEDSFWTETVADGNGSWSADIAAAGGDIGWTTMIVVLSSDEDGDTIGTFGGAPKIGVDLARDTVTGFEFTPGSMPLVEIFDAGGVPVWSGTASTGAYREFSVAPGLDLVPGMSVRVTDAVFGFTKGVTLVPLTIDVFDLEARLVAGTAEPGALVMLFVSGADGGGERGPVEPADATGAWSYTFAPDDDMRQFTDVGAAVMDAEFDSTGVSIKPAPAAIAALAGDVADLVASGELTAVQAAPLTKKLDDALGKLAENKPGAAIEKLEAFVEKVQALVQAGKLSSAAGDRLIGPATDVIAALRA